MNRREFLAAAAGTAVAARAAAGQIESIEHKGVLIRECSLDGERRSNDVVPAHPNGIQASKQTWLLIYATRTFRGVDDDLSIVYQLRRGEPDGRVIKEGFFSRVQMNWDPIGDGKASYVRQLGHPVLFGAPRGAKVQGKPAPSADVFVAKWRRTARLLDKDKNLLVHAPGEERPSLALQAVEWVQFRLNPTEDDIEIIQPAQVLRQKGYETGEAFCSGAAVKSTNQSFVQAVPYNRDGTEWADCNHFDGGRLACLKYRYDPKLGRYEWVQMGPLFGDSTQRLSEASLAQLGSQWIIAGRQGTAGVVWTRTEDPFAKIGSLARPQEPVTTTPRTAYVWADGALRLFTGDPTISPYKNARDPLYCWDIDPDAGFTASNRRVIFDSVKAGVPIRREARPMIDMCKLLPHGGGRTQWIVHRVHVAASNHPRQSLSGPVQQLPRISDQEKGSCAIHYAKVTYAEAFPSRWDY